MGIGTGDGQQLVFKRETTAGTYAGGNAQEVIHYGALTGFRQQNNRSPSSDVRPTRRIGGTTNRGFTVPFGFGCNLRPTDLDLLIAYYYDQTAMGSSASVTDTDIAVTAAGFDTTTTDLTVFAAGDIVHWSGITGIDDGVGIVTATPTTTNMAVDEIKTALSTVAAGDSITIQHGGRIDTNTAATDPVHLSLQRKTTEPSYYDNVLGGVLTGMTLTAAKGEDPTLQFTGQGLTSQNVTATPLSATPDAAAATSLYDQATGCQLRLGAAGTVLDSTLLWSGFSITWASAYNAFDGGGQLGVAEHSKHRYTISGTIDVADNDAAEAIVQSAADAGSAALAVFWQTGTLGNAINFPTIEFVTGDQQGGGNDSQLTNQLAFNVVNNTTLGYCPWFLYTGI